MNHLPTGNIETGNQSLSAMTNVLKLAAFLLARSHRQVFGFALLSLNSGHFVDADGSFPGIGSLQGMEVRLADVGNFVVKRRVGGGFNQ